MVQTSQVTGIRYRGDVQQEILLSLCIRSIVILSLRLLVHLIKNRVWFTDRFSSFPKSSPDSHRQGLHTVLVAAVTRAVFLCYSDGLSHLISEAESPSGEQRFNQFMQKLGKKPNSKNLDLNNCALSAADVTELGKYTFYSTSHFIHLFNTYLPIQLFTLLFSFPFFYRGLALFNIPSGGPRFLRNDS